MDRSTYPIEIAIALLVLVGVVFVARNAPNAPKPSGPTTLQRNAATGSSFEASGSSTRPVMGERELPRD